MNIFAKIYRTPSQFGKWILNFPLSINGQNISLPSFIASTLPPSCNEQSVSVHLTAGVQFSSNTDVASPAKSNYPNIASLQSFLEAVDHYSITVFVSSKCLENRYKIKFKWNEKQIQLKSFVSQWCPYPWWTQYFIQFFISLFSFINNVSFLKRVKMVSNLSKP